MLGVYIIFVMPPPPLAVGSARRILFSCRPSVHVRMRPISTVFVDGFSPDFCQ